MPSRELRRVDWFADAHLSIPFPLSKPNSLLTPPNYLENLKTHQPTNQPTVGNSGSTDVSYDNVQLAPLATPVIGSDSRFCNHKEPIRIVLKRMFSPRKLKFKDLATGEVALRTGNEAEFVTRLLGKDTKPIVVLKHLKQELQAVYPGSDFSGEKLFDVHFKLGESNELWFKDSELFVAFTDRVTGEPCKITLDGDWRSHNATFWLERGGLAKEGVAKVSPSGKMLKHEYVLEIAANVDAALLLLLSVLLEDILRIDRLEYSYRLTNPLDLVDRRHPKRSHVSG